VVSAVDVNSAGVQNALAHTKKTEIAEWKEGISPLYCGKNSLRCLFVAEFAAEKQANTFLLDHPIRVLKGWVIGLHVLLKEAILLLFIVSKADLVEYESDELLVLAIANSFPSRPVAVGFKGRRH
jgi:hypothetical protein